MCSSPVHVFHLDPIEIWLQSRFRAAVLHVHVATCACDAHTSEEDHPGTGISLANLQAQHILGAVRTASLS